MNKFNRLDLCSNLLEVADINRNSNKNQLELDHANNYYGIQNVIKKYANLPSERSLFGSWPHGIHYDGKIRKSELSLPYVALYSFETYISLVDLFKKRLGRNKPLILPSSLPIVFAKKILFSENIDLNKKSSSIIFFPSHSSLKLSITTNLNQQIDLIKSLRKKFKCVSLCVAWKDAIEKTYSNVYDLYDNVYCAGHQYDKDFLYNLVTIFHSHSNFTGDDLGSYLWYGISIGCKPFFSKEVLSLFKEKKKWEPFKINDKDQRITFERLQNTMNDVQLKSLSIINRFENCHSMDDFNNLLFKECNFFSYQDPKLIFEYEQLAEKYFNRFGKYSIERKLFLIASKFKSSLKKDT